MTNLRQACWGMKQLTVYRGILQDPIIETFLQLVDLLEREQLYLERMTETYAEFSTLLVEKTELSSSQLVGDPWQDYLLERILQDENVFTRKAEKVSIVQMGASLLDAVKRDLSFLQSCFSLDGNRLREIIKKRIQGIEEAEIIFPLDWLDWANLSTLEEENYPSLYYQELFKEKEFLYQTQDWGSCVEELAAYYMRVGSGNLGQYWAFYWEQGLKGIPSPDPIRLENLIGYQEQRAIVIGNTKQFLAGGGANNMLLYGDRGTGKSSTIKALVHEYGHLGLRLIEVAKHQMQEFPQIIRELRQRPQKFIIFVDDLSFEEDEIEYKYLKAVLEGGLESQPNNVLVYATSNRRHLVKESFRDREKPSEDLHIQDTVQEKLSLSDRFGITVTFTAPSSKEYLSIVEGIAAQKGLGLSKEELHKLALKWELWHNGRSGRTAKQFIEDLLGKLQNDNIA